MKLPRISVRLLCQLYRMDVDKVVCEWLAFAASKNQLKLLPDTLDQMDREVKYFSAASAQAY